MSKPYQKANIPGPEVGVSVFDPNTLAAIIKKSSRILVVIGAESLKDMIGKRTYTEFLLELGRKTKATIITTTTAYKFLSEKTKVDDLSVMSLINIINRLKDPNWLNLTGEGEKYNLVIFGGFLVYYVSQSLSTLKNYTEYRTVSLDRFHHPNARFSLPNLEKLEWGQYLEVVLSKL
ncbi:MAG: CO dehydrogenase/acetyl-CoA synthase complex subunit epsilon [Promethearchaeota archaeon]